MSDTEQKLTTIYTAADAIQGRLLQSLLEDEGIDSYLLNDALQAAAGDVPLGWSTAVRVAVSSDDAPRARAIAKSAEKRRLTEVDQPLPPSGGVVIQPAWPVCPSCGKPRTAVCPACGTPVMNLAPAEMQQAEGTGSETADYWICSTCDEPIVATFERRCESCHHDFGAGNELPVEEEPVWQDIPISPRLLLAGGALVVFVALIFLYFAVLLH